MSRFENKLCPVCRTRFIESSDIVVCPTCGTPHHRACYSIKNRCELEELHAEGWMWNGLLPDEEKEREEMLKAANLSESGPNTPAAQENSDPHHAEYPAGTPNAPYEEEQRMFEEQLGDENPFRELFNKLADKEIGKDGVSMHELVAYSATSVYHYGRAFDSFRGTSGKKRVISLNLSGGLFAPMFQGYRKMNFFGVIALLLTLAPSIVAVLLPQSFVAENVQSVQYILQLATIAIRLLLCMFSDFIYYKHCISKIKKFRKSYDGDTKSDDYYLALYEVGKPTLG